ncbi:MAG: tetratricopeptide repeat protein [Desulfobacterales bacterium]|nr:tetratricopeptide repeat protein [Desulfobacterales bacterium]
MKIIIRIFLILCVFSGAVCTDSQDNVPKKKLKITEMEENELADSFFEMPPEKNVEYGKKALYLADMAGNAPRKADALFRIGMGYRCMGNYDNALEYHLNALKLREPLSNKKDIADSLHQVGIIYFYLKNYDKALTYYRDAMKIREQTGDRRGISDSLNNIAIINYNKCNYDKALEYHRKALAIREETGDRHGIAGSCNNIGLICKDTGRYAEALKNYLRALKIFEQVGDQFEISSISNNIGELYTLIKNSDHALSYLDRGRRIAHEIGAKELLRENYAFTSDLFAAEKDYQNALYYFKKSSEMKSGIFSEKTGRRIAEMEKQYEIEKREREIELLEKESRIRQLDLNRQKLMKNSFFGGFCFVLLLAVTLYMFYLTKKKSHVRLFKANKKIMDSIRYAKLIQTSMLSPNLNTLGKFFPDSFIIWEPRDLVSGDFIFSHAVENGVLIFVADCTGHGVPGALMTMIVHSGLTKIVKDERCSDPSEILSRLNTFVKTALSQDTRHALSDDGLDAAVCFVSRHGPGEREKADFSHLIFAGARLPLFYTLNNEISVVKGDRKSIGYKRSDLSFVFSSHKIVIQEKTGFYMLTDGFEDQFGEKSTRRFGRKRFISLLKEADPRPFEEQKDIFLHAFDNYKGEHERLDDVTVVGFSCHGAHNRLPADGNPVYETEKDVNAEALTR